MHAFVKQIVEEFEPRQIVGARDVVEMDHPLWILTEVNRLRVWAGVPGRRERPSLELLELLFARGKAALVAVFRAYEAATPAAESLAVLRALGALVRAAEAQKVIDWNIDTLKPDDGKGRLLVSFEEPLNERLRAAAKVEQQSMSDFIRAAVSERVAAVEKRRPRSAATA
jgi:hypothetical protein